MTAAAGNVSMLSPEITLYDASGNPLAHAATPAAWSDNVTASLPAIVPGPARRDRRDRSDERLF